MKHSILKTALLLPCLALAITAIGILPSQADTTILVTSFDQSVVTNTVPIVTSTGAEIVFPPGSGVVGIGYFGTFNPGSISALNGDMQAGERDALAADFNIFGTTSIIGPNNSVSGSYDFNTTGNLMAGSPFIGQNIYTMIGNMATFAASTELLVYNHNQSFVQEAPLGAPTTVSLSDDWNLTGLNASSLGTSGLVLGNFGLHTSDFNGALPPAQPALSLEGLSVIPEPSRAVLGLIGLAVCGLRRRR